MSSTIERAVWTNESASSDCYQAGVEESGVEIDINTFSDSEKVSLFEEDDDVDSQYLRFVP